MDSLHLNNVESTLSVTNAAAAQWDTIVIGAGPAGAVAARALAVRGARVLLVDKARFPRDKVCGGCLNSAALALLESAGLSGSIRELGGPATSSLLLASNGRQAGIPLPQGLAISRHRLDATLVRAAIAAGAHFLDGTKAELVYPQPSRAEVRLAGSTARAATVVVADGLAATSLRACPHFQTTIAHHSRIGAGITLTTADQRFYRSGIIHMACARGGYVGLTRLEDDKLNVAAAFDPEFVRQAGGLAPAARRIIASAGLPDLRQISDAHWHGTALLTNRRRPVAHQGIFLIGDTAEYVEPFTGEGMAWGIASGLAVAPLVLEAVSQFRPEIDERWARFHRLLIHQRAIRCRVLTLLLRHDWLTRSAVRLLGRLPALAQPLTKEVATPFTLLS